MGWKLLDRPRYVSGPWDLKEKLDHLARGANWTVGIDGVTVLRDHRVLTEMMDSTLSHNKCVVGWKQRLPDGGNVVRIGMDDGDGVLSTWRSTRPCTFVMGQTA